MMFNDAAHAIPRSATHIMWVEGKRFCYKPAVLSDAPTCYYVPM